MTSGRPTGTYLQISAVVCVSNEKPSRRLYLGVATQAQICVALQEHLLVDRAMRIVANRAALAEGFVFEDKWPGLVPMTLRTAFVLPGHGQPAFRLQNVPAMRIVALDTIHVPFDDRMMLRQVEFGLDIHVTLETGRRVVSGVDDKVRVASGFDVFAARTVTGFAPGFTDHGSPFKMNPRVGAHGKFPGDLLVAVQAGFVADIMRAGDFQGHDDLGRRGGAGIQKSNGAAGNRQGHEDDQRLLQPHPQLQLLKHELNVRQVDWSQPRL